MCCRSGSGFHLTTDPDQGRPKTHKKGEKEVFLNTKYLQDLKENKN
jgi:hypothetical protein